MQTVLEQIANAVVAARNCEQSGNAEWRARHLARLDAIARERLPSGSGFDNATRINFAASSEKRICLTTSFHHMDSSGGYCGWTDHAITVEPAFIGRFNLRIHGRDRNGIKDYIAEAIAAALDSEGLSDAELIAADDEAAPE